MNLFEAKLDRILSDHVVLSENIEKKWPHVYRALKDALIEQPAHVRRGLLAHYALTVKDELRNASDGRGGTKMQAMLDRVPDFSKDAMLSDVAKQAVKAGLPRELRPPTRLEYIAEYFKKWLVEADPVAQASNGRKTPFVNHIVRWLISTKAVFPDDIKPINELLEKYVKLKNNLGADVPDLDDVDDPNILRSQIMEYAENDTYKKLEDKKLPSIVPGIEAYRIDTYDEGKDITCDSGWCVADEMTFRQYTPPFYIFVRKAGEKYKRLALFNVYSGELKDVYNSDLPLETMGKLAPILDYILSSSTDVDHNKLLSNYEQEFMEFENPMDEMELLSVLAPIIHLMPKINSEMKPSALAEMAEMIWDNRNTHPRWPDYLEKRLQTDPKSFIQYVNAVAQHDRVPELDEDLIELAYVHFDEDFEYIVMLLEYFGSRSEKFNNGWPELSELLNEIVKHDLQSKFMEDMRYANRDGIRGFRLLTGGEFSTLTGGIKWDGVDKGPRWPKPWGSRIRY